ncbi:MAG: hypothetical protein LR015_14020 [Verrucomicrobia bacterium]|nr:hypothetical protein [Verrucomicrobiota bacterium]
MLVSVITSTALFGWCIWRVARTPKASEKMHGFEFETPDETEQNQLDRSNL